MSIFGRLFGGVKAHSVSNTPYTTYTSSTTQPLGLAQAQINPQWWSQGGQGGGMGAGMGKGSAVFRIDQNLMYLMRYAELFGDTVDIVELKPNEETTDPKIALLKVADVGTVIKHVGMKIDDDKFAVYRELG